MAQGRDGQGRDGQGRDGRDGPAMKPALSARGREKAAQRGQRLAAALRENLHRRKAQMQARADASSDAAPAADGKGRASAPADASSDAAPAADGKGRASAPADASSDAAPVADGKGRSRAED